MSMSPKSRSKHSSVSETPVVSVERPLSPPSDGLVSPPLVNGEIKPGKSNVPIVSINANNDRDSGSVSPRQQSLELSGQKLTYAQIMKKKQEKEAKEAAERAAKEAAEENHAETSGKAKSEDKVPASSIQEVQVEAKKEEDKVPGKGRLSKTSSGPSSGDKDKKLGSG